LVNLCSSDDGIFTEAAVARMDQIIAADGLTVMMEAMLNHPVLKKDELSLPIEVEPDEVIQRGLLLWLPSPKPRSRPECTPTPESRTTRSRPYT